MTIICLFTMTSLSRHRQLIFWCGMSKIIMTKDKTHVHLCIKIAVVSKYGFCTRKAITAKLPG